MPIIVLEDKRRAQVSTKRSTVIKKSNKKEIIRHRVSSTITIFALLKEGEKKSDIELSLTTSTTCSERDSFNPRYGRQEAVRKLLKTIGGRITKSDRKKVITTLCPEFFLTQNDRMRMEYERLKKIFEPKIEIVEEKPVA